MLFKQTRFVDRFYDTVTGGVYSIYFYILIVILILLHVILAIWVYRDAKKSNIRSVITWTILTAVGGLIALGAYLYIRRKRKIRTATQIE